MKDDNDQTRGQVQPPERDHSLNTSRDAAANVIRHDIEQIYSGDEAPYTGAERELAAKAQADHHRRTLDQQSTPHAHTNTTESWKQYHSSWQHYYQQYYERYYLNHLHSMQQQSFETAASQTSTEEDATIAELHDRLIGSVQQQAKTVRKSRHFAPIATAVVFASIFLFLQYNRFLFATVQAYVSPGSIEPQNVIVDQATNTKVSAEPRLIIPKINVDAPIVYGANAADNAAVEDALRSGVVHYPIANAASSPGQNGATTILGHSSNDVFDNGAYKFIFVQLNKLQEGDTFFVNHESTRYTYKITRKEIINPRDVGKVTGDPTKPSIILITCDPPGTALNRLLVFADQVNPNPAKSTKAPSSGTTKPQKEASIGGEGTTFLQNIFGQ
jgi:sortase A